LIESTSKLAINAQKLVINGTGFDAHADGNSVDFNLGAVGAVTAATTTQLTVTLSAQPTVTGPLTAVVTAFGVSSGEAVQVATVVYPPIVSANSILKARSARTLVIYGNGFDPMAASNTVALNLGAIGAVTAASRTRLTVTLSAQPNAAGPLTAVVTSFGVSSGDAVQVATVVDAPTVSASTALLAQTARSLVINGAGFNPTAARNAVALNLGAVVGAVTAATTTQLTVTLATRPNATGPLTAVVTAFGGTSGAAVQVANVVDPPIVVAGGTFSCALTMRGDVRCAFRVFCAAMSRCLYVLRLAFPVPADSPKNNVSTFLPTKKVLGRQRGGRIECAARPWRRQELVSWIELHARVAA
jgi:hypothetical protein